MREILLLGAGNSRQKKICIGGDTEWHGQLFTVDMNPNCGADLVWDMEHRPLPLADGRFDEIHGYDCFEHWGRLGDWRGWFDEMGEYHRLLKPGGTFHALVPCGTEAFADPGHTRVFDVNHFKMLSQEWYAEELAAGRPVTDYRWYWTKNFRLTKTIWAGHPAPHHFAVVLERVEPIALPKEPNKPVQW